MNVNITYEINEAFKENKNTNMFLYPFVEINNSTGTITLKTINNEILTKLNKITSVTIEEYNYRDLVKIIENYTNVSYTTKQTFGKILNGLENVDTFNTSNTSNTPHIHLLCWANYLEIHESKFPHAHTGIIKEIKIMELLKIPNLCLELTELMLENNAFCIRIKQKPSSSNHKKEMRREISEILTYIEKLK